MPKAKSDHVFLICLGWYAHKNNLQGESWHGATLCPYKQCLLTSFERDKNMNRAEVKKQQDVLTCGYALSTPVILPIWEGSSLAYQRPKQDGSGKTFCPRSQDPWVQVLIVPLKRSSASNLGESASLCTVAVSAIIFSPSQVTFSIDSLPM